MPAVLYERENNLVCLLVIIISNSLVMLGCIQASTLYTTQGFCLVIISLMTQLLMSVSDIIRLCWYRMRVSSDNQIMMMWNVRRREWLDLQNWEWNGVNVQWRLKASNWGVWLLKQSVAVQLRFEYFVMTCCWCCKRTVKLFQASSETNPGWFCLVVNEREKTNLNPFIPSIHTYAVLRKRGVCFCKGEQKQNRFKM